MTTSVGTARTVVDVRQGGRRPVRRDPAAARRPVLPQAAVQLLADAGLELGRSIRAGQPAERYSAAHLAALRAAAAVLATRARPGRRRASAWELLGRLAPEFAEWAGFFAAGSSKRQAADAGATHLISAREADDMVRQAAEFIDLVEHALAAPGS